MNNDNPPFIYLHLHISVFVNLPHCCFQSPYKYKSDPSDATLNPTKLSPCDEIPHRIYSDGPLDS